MQQATGVQTQANPGREIDIVVNQRVYKRLPVKTRLINLGDNYIEIAREYVQPFVQPGDFVTISEKVIAICQQRVVHESKVKASWLAKLICRYVTKYPDDVGFENPKKMQVAINEAGYLRMILAVGIGGIMKYVFGKPGWFYRIAGNNINAIDGFNPIAIPPFNEYAMLAPAEPDKVCAEIEDAIGVPAVIVDANNVNTEIMGTSPGIAVMHLNHDDIRQIVQGNPMGQEDEHTPFLIIRPGE